MLMLGNDDCACDCCCCCFNTTEAWYSNALVVLDELTGGTWGFGLMILVPVEGVASCEPE